MQSDFEELNLKAIDPIEIDESPQYYVLWDNGLRAAAGVALALGKPLLLTGDPGVGKSEFASWLAHELALGTREKFVVKSTTEANDLFYTYDTLGRFHDAQIVAADKPLATATEASAIRSADPFQYLKYQALGVAILNSVGRETARSEGFINSEMSNLFPEQACKTVVLIDEIDKAPRDVPNDILDEIDKMTFSVREVGSNKVKSNNKLRPVVVITSNSERDLPEPFLRRCIYYHIPFPDNEKDLKKILLSRLHSRLVESSPLMADAQKLLSFLRSGTLTFTRKPGLAELLDWLYELTRKPGNQASRLSELKEDYVYQTAKTTLLKHAEDQKKATPENWRQWLTQAGIGH